MTAQQKLDLARLLGIVLKSRGHTSPTKRMCAVGKE